MKFSNTGTPWFGGPCSQTILEARFVEIFIHKLHEPCGTSWACDSSTVVLVNTPAVKWLELLSRCNAPSNRPFVIKFDSSTY